MTDAAKTEQQQPEPERKGLPPHLEEHKWEKGCPSPNPDGRPSYKPFRDAVRKFYREHPERLDELVQRLDEDARSHRKTLAPYSRTFMRDLLDGPLERPIVGPQRPDGGHDPVHVVFELVEGPARPEEPEKEDAT